MRMHLEWHRIGCVEVDREQGGIKRAIANRQIDVIYIYARFIFAYDLIL